MKDYENRYLKPKMEKDQKENQKVTDDYDRAEQGKWARAFHDALHKKEMAPEIYQGNLSRLGKKESDQNRVSSLDRLQVEKIR